MSSGRLTVTRFVIPGSYWSPSPLPDFSASHAEYVKGEWADEVIYAMLAREWQDRRPVAAPVAP